MTTNTYGRSPIVEALFNNTGSLAASFRFQPEVDEHGFQLPDDVQLANYRAQIGTALEALKGSASQALAHFKRAGREPILTGYLASFANVQTLLKDPLADLHALAVQAQSLYLKLSQDESLVAFHKDIEAMKEAPKLNDMALDAFSKCAYMLVSSKRAMVLVDNKARGELIGGVSADAPLYNVLDISSAKLLMANRPLITYDVKGNERKVNVVDLWTESMTRREVYGITMKPGCDDRVVNGQFNVWQGWAVQSEAGNDDEPFWELLLALCNDNAEYFTFIRKYLAHMVQRPQERPMCAIGIAGPQGTGKSSLARVIGALMHQSHYNGAMTMEDITGRFTGSLATTLFGFLDEASWGGDIAGAGRLKAFITATDDRIEFKGVDAFTVPTYKRILFASNNPYYYHADHDDRRLLPLEPDGTVINKQSEEFWGRFWTAFNEGKMLANLMHTLGAEDLTDWVPHAELQKLDITTGGELAEQSMNTVERWVKHCLNIKGFETPVREGSQLIDVSVHLKPRIHGAKLIESYEFFCSQSSLDKNRKMNLNDAKAAKLLRDVFGKAGPVTIGGKNQNGRKFEWDEAREAFAKRFRFNIEWDAEPVHDVVNDEGELQIPQNVRKLHG